MLVLTAGASSAAPCAVGTTTSHQGASSSADKSSMADGASTANTTPGAKAETPGTVGAPNNVGAGTKPGGGEQKPAEGKVVKPGSNDGRPTVDRLVPTIRWPCRSRSAGLFLWAVRGSWWRARPA